MSIKKKIEECVRCFATAGSVALLPTETVYGLMCNWFDEKARNRIYNLKCRDIRKPLQMLVYNISILEDVCKIEVPDRVKSIVERLCPGPLTIVWEPDSKSDTKKIKTKTIGLRIPKHEFMLSLLREYAQPLAATSANLSGEPPALSVSEALTQLNGTPDYIVDYGELSPDSLPSTVVKISRTDFNILRQGPVSEQTIRKILRNF